MMIFIILAFLILIFAVIFALQNTITVTVTFLFWQFHGSLALVLLVALGAGLVIGILAYSPSLLRTHMAGRRMKKQLTELETSLAEHKQRLEESLLKLHEQATPGKPTESGETPPEQPTPAK
jgi:putative membrane protein